MTQARVQVVPIFPHLRHQRGKAVFLVFQTMGKCLSLAAGHGLCRHLTEAGRIGRLDRRLQKWTLTRREKLTAQAGYRDLCLHADKDHAHREVLRYNSQK